MVTIIKDAFLNADFTNEILQKLHWHCTYFLFNFCLIRGLLYTLLLRWFHMKNSTLLSQVILGGKRMAPNWEICRGQQIVTIKSFAAWAAAILLKLWIIKIGNVFELFRNKSFKHRNIPSRFYCRCSLSFIFKKVNRHHVVWWSRTSNCHLWFV